VQAPAGVEDVGQRKEVALIGSAAVVQDQETVWIGGSGPFFEDERCDSGRLSGGCLHWW
jgi:hypothetical protein